MTFGDMKAYRPIAFGAGLAEVSVLVINSKQLMF